MLRRTLLAALAAGLSGCSGGLVDEAAETTARHAFDLLRARDYTGLEGMFTAQHRGPQMRETLQLMRAAVPDGAPTSAKRIGWHVEANTTVGKQVTLIHAYEYPGRTVKTTTVLVPDAQAGWKLAGMHVDLPGAGDS